MISLLSLTQKQFADQVVFRLGKGRRHAERLYSQWIRHGNLETDAWVEPQAASLMQSIASLLDVEVAPISNLLEDHGTTKFLLRLRDGLETESVIIPMKAGLTLCVSSQVGCKMGCAFCETGRMGLLRSLSPAEITQQLFVARVILKAPIRNIVFMGMGEPFDNYDHLMQAIRVMTDPKGFGIGPRHLTVSTSGCVDALDRFTQEADPAIHLAVSINAPTDAIRSKIMPVNHRWPLQELKAALHRYAAGGRRSILIEYVLLKDLNDSIELADALAEYLHALPVKINLIPYNAQRKSRFLPPEPEIQEKFLQRLRLKGYQTLLRYHKGRSIMAACGQLGNRERRSQK